MQLNSYVTFNGRCEEAFKFYETCLGGRVKFSMTYGNSPMAEQTPADCRERILHATFALGDLVLTGADVLATPGRCPAFANPGANGYYRTAYAPDVLRAIGHYGLRYRGRGWGMGMTILTAVGALLPALAPEDRSLALFHGAVRVAEDTAGSQPRFDLEPLPATRV